MKTALVHDWLSGYGGGEKVLESMYDLYPSKIFTLVKNESKLKNTIFEGRDIETSFIQNLPLSSKVYRNYLPFFPLAIEQFDLSTYDLVLSSSHAVAKGVLTHANQLHICYCHTPMRYAWDLYAFHMSQVKGPKKLIAQLVLHYMRKWDLSSVNRVDHFIANSKYVARRIKKVYGRDSEVIYPPVDTQSFYTSKNKQDYYITYSRLVPYKKIDMIAHAFSKMPDKKLIIIGDGPEMPKVKTHSSKNIEILGYRSNDEIRKLLSEAKAMVFAAEEDFGIVMAESLASGTPVIAFGKGASSEIIDQSKTGILFPEQDVDSLIKAVQEFEKNEDSFDPLYIKQTADSFSQERFAIEYKNFVEKKWSDFKNSRH
ncbi:MAG: glycosyltransferase family 4 protein [Chlamydiae bacterium]|nr:glycosyltransferase family 4 protein [Chlamydiota bacterium]